MWNRAPHTLLLSLAILVFSGCYQSHFVEGGRSCGGAVCGEAEQCCPTCDGRGDCQTILAMCPPVSCGGCASAFDCAPSEYCEVPAWACDIAGACVPRPDGCDDDCPGVCGCDRVDYCNECEANRVGVTIASEGSCDGEPCGPDTCGLGQVCCSLCFGEVSCEPADVGCPDIFCPAECVVNEECAPDEYCAFERFSCGPSRIPGECVLRPDDCPTDCDAICGCDGISHCNECFANAAGVNISRSEDCLDMPCGRGGAVCSPLEYCDLGGDCGASDAWSCQERPTLCSDVEDTVCGCDSRTYFNACFAAQNGVTVASTGPCDVGPIARTCREVLATGPGSLSGVYNLFADDGSVERVYCDLRTDGGGWTLVAASRRRTLDDMAGPYHGDLAVRTPTGGLTSVWDGMRAAISPRSDVRFTCRREGASRRENVDLSFYDVPWYAEWTTGSDAESCFSEDDGRGFDRPAPARRDNVAGVELPRGTPWTRDGYLEGEDSCDDEDDFTVDFRDRGMDSNESDGTDWGEDDSVAKCSIGTPPDGVWQIWVRER